MRALLFCLLLLPFGLWAQTAAERSAAHTEAQSTRVLQTLPTEFARAQLRYTESFTQGDARTQAVSRDKVIELMQQSIAHRTGNGRKHQEKMLALFERYSTEGRPESAEQAKRVLRDFERSLRVEEVSDKVPVIE